MVQSVKLIFSRRVKDELVERGFIPVRKREDVKHEGFYIWEFEVSPAFLEAFEEIAFKKGGQNNG